MKYNRNYYQLYKQKIFVGVPLLQSIANLHLLLNQLTWLFVVILQHKLFGVPANSNKSKRTRYIGFRTIVLKVFVSNGFLKVTTASWIFLAAVNRKFHKCHFKADRRVSAYSKALRLVRGFAWYFKLEIRFPRKTQLCEGATSLGFTPNQIFH